MYCLLADLVVVLHIAFVFFAVLGALAVARWPRLVWLPLPAVTCAVLVELAGWICPLTLLEIRLRELAGGVGYDSSFVEHHVIPVLYPEHLTREVQLFLGAGVVFINVVAYAWILTGSRRDSGRSKRIW